MQQKQISILIYSLPVVLLLIPFIAMNFTSEVQWTLFDFLVAGALLFGTAAACDYVLRNTRPVKFQVLFCLVILLVLFIIWAELAVGIFN